METESPDTINRTAIQQTSPTVTTVPVMKPPPPGILPKECKFNLVIYGIAEFPKETPRHDWQKSDLTNCLSFVSKLNTEIDSHFIRDCLRLGKYQKQLTCPRPILLELNC